MVEWWISGSEVSTVESTVEKRWKYRYGGKTITVEYRWKYGGDKSAVENFRLNMYGRKWVHTVDRSPQ